MTAVGAPAPGPDPGGDTAEVVVIGAGLAGVAAALDCADAGARVTVVEARARLGGAASSGRRRDVDVDTGQHVFLRCCTSYRALVHRWGGDDLVTLQPRLHVPVVLVTGSAGRPGRLRRSRLPLPAPLHLAPALATYGGLPVRQRAQVARTAAALGRLADGGAAESRLGEWLATQGTSEAAVRGFWEVLTVATLNTPVAEASLRLAATVLRRGFLGAPGDGDIGWSRGPLGASHDRAAAAALSAAGVRLRRRTRVTRLQAPQRRAGHRWQLETRGGPLRADAVILAVPPAAAADLIAELPGVLGGGRAGWAADGALASSPIINVHLRYDRVVAELPADAPFVAVIGSPLQWLFDRSAAIGLPPRQGQYLVSSQSAADAALGRPAAELVDLARRELHRIYPRSRGAALLDAFVTREPHATIRQGAGVGSHRPVPGLIGDGLALAGAWTETGWPVTMESAVRSGHAAAGAVLAGLR